MDRLLLVLLMLSAQMEHLLDLENVARAGVSASLHDQFTEACRVHVGNQLADLH